TDKPLSILFHTITGALCILPEKDWQAMAHPETDRLIHTSEKEALIKEGFLVEAGIDESTVYRRWMNQHIHDTSTISSKVLVTRRCNNRCTYCILDSETSDMSLETARVMDEFYIGLIEEKRPLCIRDDFLGGEPLLNVRIILESAQRRFYFCRGRGIDYGFTITTNGTLINQSVISTMQEVGLTGIRVSLAGPKEIHDRLRPGSKGEPTYSRIVSNLRLVSEIAQVFIEYQYDAGCTDFLGFSDMLDDLAANGVEVKNIAVTPILPRRSCSSFDRKTDYPRIEIFLKSEAARRGFPVYDEPPATACMAERKSKMVFDTDGSILPCPTLQSGEMAYGHVATGIDFVAESQLLERNLPDKCLNECELLPMCQGACRLQALVKQGDFNGIDCHYDLQRTLLEDWMRQKAVEDRIERN
ncbi:MAG: radical SAM protein, partial [Desulfobacterales bacterium]